MSEVEGGSTTRRKCNYNADWQKKNILGSAKAMLEMKNPTAKQDANCVI